MLLECSCPACHLPPAGGAVLQVGSAGPAHDVAAVALVDLLPRPELVVAHLQQGLVVNYRQYYNPTGHSGLSPLLLLVWFWYWCSSNRPAMSSKPPDLQKTK